MAVVLNEMQEKAVTTASHYVRVVAGAGSGKTKVLTMRVAYLIEKIGVDPKKIVAITFTNKAANEMKKRVKDLLGEVGNGPHISTIHSLCVRILREDIRNFNYPANFTVLDVDDQKAILKEAYDLLGIEVKAISYSEVLNYIADNKVEKVSPDQALIMANGHEITVLKAKAYAYYSRRQDQMYALDFDDLLLWTVRLFKKFPIVLGKWQHRFQYILVDEFQDIDKVQYELIKQLADSTNEVYVVGDPDQTIYTWRGANVEIIMNFEKDFSPCETIILAQNYRSTPMILNGSNSLIAHNRQRLEKNLFTDKSEGDKIVHYSAASSEAEAMWITMKIMDLKKKGASYADIAILYRANYISRTLEKSLRDFQIPYVIYGGLRFYDRAEIKDMLCYLRMLVTGDDLAFKRVVNMPRRGVGSKTLGDLFEASRKNQITMYQAIDKISVGPVIKNSLDSFRKMIERFKQQQKELSLDKLLETVFEDTGYRAMLEKEHEDERILNVKELINDMTDYMQAYPDSNLEEYLQMVNLYTDQDEVKSAEFVQLMTIHAAKGLEFDTVFVAGMSEGIFPSQRALIDGPKALEEERRLAYVACTRAKNKLFLSDPQGFSYVLSNNLVPSRFINEIDEKYRSDIGRRIEVGLEKVQQSVQDKGDNFAVPSKTTKYRNGELITHAVFGDGVVVKINGNIMDVAFNYPYGVKSLMMNHPAIKKKG